MSGIRCPFCGVEHAWPKPLSKDNEGWLLDIPCSCGGRCRGFDETSEKIAETLRICFGRIEKLEGPVRTRDGDVYLRIEPRVDVRRDPVTGEEVAIHLLWTRVSESKVTKESSPKK